MDGNKTIFNMLHFTKNANLYKCSFLFAMISLSLIFGSCGNKKAQKQEESQPKYRIKVVADPVNLNIMSPENPWGFASGDISLHLTDEQGKPVIFDPEGNYEDLIIPAFCAGNILYKVVFKRLKSEYYAKDGLESDGFDYINSTYAIEAYNNVVKLLEKYINYVWELPLTDQSIDSTLKDFFNRSYYGLDIKHKTIKELTRNYDQIVYGFIDDDKVFYNEDDIPQISLTRNDHGVMIGGRAHLVFQFNEK